MDIIKQTGTANTTSSPGRKIEYLAIHYTAGVSCGAGAARSCASWFANPSAGGSADYICDERDLVQYNPDPYNRYCWAVGSKSKYNTKGGRLWQIAMNSNCISLEICSGNTKGKITYPNDPAYYFTNAVLVKAVEVVKYLMQLYGIDADHVIRHYDCNGKCCPGVPGWNADSGNEAKWNDFHSAIGGEPIKWYRVRLDWGQPDTQIGAFINLDKAKECADAHPGFSVYDDQGQVVYKSEAKGTQAASLNGLSEANKIKAIAPLYQAVAAKTGMLASVGLAQFCLESGYGSTDLAQYANNLHGMKCSLSGNTWPNSTWDGVSKYRKRTAEQDPSGHTYYIYADFRKYPCIEDSIADRAAYYLGAMNGNKRRYPGIENLKTAEEQIRAIKAGGYATDVNYVAKLMDLVRRFNLEQYDKAAPAPTPTPEPTPTPTPTPTPEIRKRRVQINAYKNESYADNCIARCKEQTGFDAFKEYGSDGNWHVYCGSFENMDKANERLDYVRKHGYPRAFFVDL